MSHIVKIQSKLFDATAVGAACHRLNLAKPVVGSAKLYSGEATGLIVQLPDWKYPLVIDTGSGSVQFDNYQGQWGDPARIDQFFQCYEVEKAKLEAHKKGYAVTEQLLQDGSILVEIIEAR